MLKSYLSISPFLGYREVWGRKKEIAGGLRGIGSCWTREFQSKIKPLKQRLKNYTIHGVVSIPFFGWAESSTFGNSSKNKISAKIFSISTTTGYICQ